MLALASAIVGRDPQGNGQRKTANGRPGRPVAVNRRDMDHLFARYTVDTLLHRLVGAGLLSGGEGDEPYRLTESGQAALRDGSRAALL